MPTLSEELFLGKLQDTEMETTPWENLKLLAAMLNTIQPLPRLAQMLTMRSISTASDTHHYQLSGSVTESLEKKEKKWSKAKQTSSESGSDMTDVLGLPYRELKVTSYIKAIVGNRPYPRADGLCNRWKCNKEEKQSSGDWKHCNRNERCLMSRYPILLVDMTETINELKDMLIETSYTDELRTCNCERHFQMVHDTPNWTARESREMNKHSRYYR